VELRAFAYSARYQFTDDWNLLLAQSYQNMEADGRFTQYPVVIRASCSSRPCDVVHRAGLLTRISSRIRR